MRRCMGMPRDARAYIPELTCQLFDLMKLFLSLPLKVTAWAAILIMDSQPAFLPASYP